jgi:hypothetical protein
VEGAPAAGSEKEVARGCGSERQAGQEMGQGETVSEVGEPGLAAALLPFL